MTSKKSNKTVSKWQKVFDSLDQNTQFLNTDHKECKKKLYLESEKKISLNWIVFIVFLAYIILGAFLYSYLPNKLEEKGQFGDMFGALNGLVSALAFGVLVYSIWLQRDDLKTQNTILGLQFEELQLQREELADTREELARSADAQSKSSLALEKQLESMDRTVKLDALNKVIEISTSNLENLPDKTISTSSTEMVFNMRLYYIQTIGKAEKQLMQLTEEIFQEDIA